MKRSLFVRVLYRFIIQILQFSTNNPLVFIHNFWDRPEPGLLIFMFRVFILAKKYPLGLGFPRGFMRILLE